MILSIIIVNYNVKYFLEQCLSSLRKAINGNSSLREEAEVFVVDNASTDASVPFLKPLFPEFHFISSLGNNGFSKGNNLALSKCSGEFILFLNPDTLLAEDSLDQCLSFLQIHTDAGAVGVRMIDGSGHFLKESKRGFPSARVSFFKMTGLAACFPSSRLFAAYYAGHLNPRLSHPVEILSGAFMMVRKNVLDKSGGFDEQFFMYAEDIDLSYRIGKAGFRNYYLASTTIIHFKGESTRRDIPHVKQFYLAMNQFLKKHFSETSSPLLFFFLNLAVILRRSMETVRLEFRKNTRTDRKTGPLFIKGEPEELSLVKNAILRAGIRITDKESEAGGILFCESECASWKSIIHEMDNAKHTLPCFVHGYGTHALVRSRSGREQGEAIPL